MKKISIKDILKYLSLISVISSGIYVLEGRYALAASHEKLEKRVTVNELQGLKQSALKNKYFLKDQLRKYPEDSEIKDQLELTVEEIKGFDKQIKSNRRTSAWYKSNG